MLKVMPVFFLLVFLSSCATHRVVTPEEKIKSNGLVVLSFITNASTFGKIYADPTMVAVRSVKTNKIYHLSKNYNEGSVLLFNGWLPEGQYEISSIFSTTQVATEGLFNLHETFRKFSVKAARITDLQTLIYQPTGGNKVILISAKQSINISNYIKTKFKSVARILLSQELDKTELQLELPLRERVLKSASNMGVIISTLSDFDINAPSLQHEWKQMLRTNELISLSRDATIHVFRGNFNNEHIYFGSKLGVIYKVNSDGNWKSYDTGELQDVTYVYAKGSTMLAGFGNGKIMLSRSDGVTWEVVTEANELGDITYISKLGENDYIIASNKRKISHSKMVAHKLSLHVLSTDSFQLDLLKEIDLETHSFWSHTPSSFDYTVAKTNNKLVVAISSTTLLYYDLDKKTWNSEEVDDSYQLIKFDSKKNTLTRSNMIGSSIIYTSSNEGNTWVRQKEPQKHKTVNFKNTKIRFE